MLDPGLGLAKEPISTHFNSTLAKWDHICFKCKQSVIPLMWTKSSTMLYVYLSPQRPFPKRLERTDVHSCMRFRCILNLSGLGTHLTLILQHAFQRSTQ